MKPIKIFLIFIMFFGSCFAMASEKKKIFVFSLSTDQAEEETIRKYSEILVQKLIMSDEFEIITVSDFTYKIQNIENPYPYLKTAVYNYCIEKEIKSAIFGYFLERESFYEVNVFWYNIEDDNKISEYIQKLYNSSSFENSAKKCAVEFVARSYSMKSTRFLIGSAFIPGLGQMFMKNYLKSALFFGGVAYFLYKLNSVGSLKSFDNDTDIKVVEINSVQRYKYFLNGKEISYVYFKRLPSEYNDYNNKLEKKKNLFRISAVLLHLTNITDTLLSIKKYNDKIKIEQKLTIQANPWGNNPNVGICFNF